MLEIEGKRKEILFLVQKYQILIIHGKSGCGKSTKIPQFLVEAGYATSKQVVVVQPTRLAAYALARQVAFELGEPELGNSVAYLPAFDSKAEQAKVVFLTDDALYNQIFYDPLLTNYSVVVLDGVHERTLYTDLLCMLLKKILNKRPDLRLILCSATIKSRFLVDYFGKIPFVFQIGTRTFPVKMFFVKNVPLNYAQSTFKTIVQLHQSKPPGDILAFLPEKRDIEAIYEMIQQQISLLSNGPERLQMFPLRLHSGLPLREQEKIFALAPFGTRKIILSTSIAESCLTIVGLAYVIDAGLDRIKFYDAACGIEYWLTVYQSASSAIQRANRVGRTCPGEVYRLFPSSMLQREMKHEALPGIRRSDLTQILLQLKSIGMDTMAQLDFPTTPFIQTLARGFETLFRLKAIDRLGALTKDVGGTLAMLPIEPMHGKMALNSVTHSCTNEMLSIVSMLSVDGLFVAEATDAQRNAHAVEEGDHITLLNIYNAFIESGMSSSWCQRNGINPIIINNAAALRKQLVGYLQHLQIPIASCPKPVPILKCIASALSIENVAVLDDGSQGSYRLCESGKRLAGIFVHPHSCLFKRMPEYLMFDRIVCTSKLYVQANSVVEYGWFDSS